MSYILDALKKSEEKRNTLNLPTTPEPYAHLQGVENHRIQWTLVALFLAAGSGWFITQSMQAETVPTTAIHSTATQPIAVVTEKNNRPPEPELKQAEPKPEQLEKPATAQPILPIQVQEVLVEKTEVTPTKTIPASPDKQADNPGSSMLEHTSPPGQLTDTQKPAVADMQIPNRADLPLEKQHALPEIVIAGHIYDQSPSARMVVINGKVRRENQRFGDGLILEEITTKGITLSHHGTIFRMGVFD